MRLPNHIAGGFCLTGFVASVFFSINVLASPATLAAVIFGSIIPDVDNPKSLAGKIFYPIAKLIHKKAGHRTLTHSLLCIVLVAFVSSTIEKTFLNQMTISVILTCAWFFHILLDTFTLQGVQLMFPFSYEPYWMFEKPESRIRNGDFKAEGVFFIAFVVLSFAQQGLWQNGFWTTFNNQFGTLQHLESEYRKSADALQVTATAMRGTERVEIPGYLVDLSGGKVVLLGEQGFEVVGDDEMFLSASFRHSGQQIKISQQNLISVSPDSLNKLLTGKLVESIDVAGSGQFQVTRNGIAQKVSAFKGEFLPDRPIFSDIKQVVQDTFISDQSYLAEIELLRKELALVRKTNDAARAAADERTSRLNELRNQFRTERDLVKRKRIVEYLQELKAQRPPTPDEAKEIALVARIQKIQHEQKLKEQLERQRFALELEKQQAQAQGAYLTGIVRFLELIKGDPFRVIAVKDGDTIEAINDSTRQTITVRLAHVDAPEKSQAFGKAAKQFVSEFCYNKTVSIDVQETDRYGRAVAVVYVNGRNMNLEIVKAGLAWHYKQYSKDKSFAEAEAAARSEARGLWQQSNPTPPWQFRH